MAAKRNAKLVDSRPAKKQKRRHIKAADRKLVPIPAPDDEELDVDQDLDVLKAGSLFLSNLDQNAIARSKKEIIRLHELSKPVRQTRIVEDDDLPSIQSHSEDEASWSSAISEPEEQDDSDLEMAYERIPRKRRGSWENRDPGIQRLPIKLTNGRLVQRGAQPAQQEVSDDESHSSPEPETRPPPPPPKEDVSTAARFGRPAVIDVIKKSSKQARVQAAKDEIASICQDIISDPESGLGLLRRLHTFSLAKISTPTHPEPVENDAIIRKLALLSQLAVFKDIIPGYRIRPLTDHEKSEKVSQQVARTREWEQGLVGTYQNYLRALEEALRANDEMSEVALQCICTLLTNITHFNFRVNLMTCIVARLSKRRWDQSSDLCLSSLIQVLKADFTGVPSLEIVRLLNRMIKERQFRIHPAVLGCLLHLRLKTELGTRASDTKVDQDSSTEKNRRMKSKTTSQAHLSKKSRKALKERKQIEREFREAEAEVDAEERTATQTETLKLLFVLYFRILKEPTTTPLLVAALQGISKYAHLVNIDFFRDLMAVLKDMIHSTSFDTETPLERIHRRLTCILTAFELLSGQGEALNIDLGDFISQLYAIIPELMLENDMDVPVQLSHSTKSPSQTDLLFQALGIVFSPRTLGASAPTWRSAAFSKRLLSAALHWPAGATLQALNFVGGLLSKDRKLNALLSTDERTFDGVYRPDIDDPQLCNPMAASLWELYALATNHWDTRVQKEAQKLLDLATQS